MPLADENAGMVNALGKPKLEDLSLQPSFQEILNLQTQDVIQLHLALVQHTNSHQTPEQSISWQIGKERGKKNAINNPISKI